MGKLTVRMGPLAGLHRSHALLIIEWLKDFSLQRAAEAAGMTFENATKVMKREDVRAIVDGQLEELMHNSQIDAQWLLFELVDNHRLARQQGNIAASNAALRIIAQHVTVKALAPIAVDHTSSDGSMTPAPAMTPDELRGIADELEAAC